MSGSTVILSDGSKISCGMMVYDNKKLWALPAMWITLLVVVRDFYIASSFISTQETLVEYGL